jgi:hypothetical protein
MTFAFTPRQWLGCMETGDQPAVYVNQYSVADKLKPLVSEKVREMWEREVIEEGPPGNSYNMSLLEKG